MTTITDFHREVKKAARVNPRPNDLPMWAIDKLNERPIWVVKLACGHVHGPLITDRPPASMHCRACAADPLQRKNDRRGNAR
jgi:hypothetical protein